MYNIFDFGQRIYLSIYSSFSINNTSNKFLKLLAICDGISAIRPCNGLIAARFNF